MHFIKYFFLIFLFCSVVSCKKSFLEVNDQGTVLRQEYVTDLNSTGQFLNGIYVLLTRDFYLGVNQIYPDLIADNIKPKNAGGLTLLGPYNWAQKIDGTEVDLGNLWKYGFQIARSCSFVVEKADAYKEQNLAKANDMKAQALAIRALVEFTLVNIFAQSYNYTANASHPGIPYVITSDLNKMEARLTVAEIYTNIITDLNTAISSFSGTENVFLMNVKAAKALLARVYLFKADYTSAKNLAVQVGKAVPIMTGSDYPSKLFTFGETEALFQLMPTTTQSNNFFTTFQGRYFVGTSGQVQFLATSDIASLLTKDPLDVRKAWIKSTGPGKDTIKKFPINVIPGFSPQTLSYLPTIFRSSEMYLTAAECFAKLNMQDSAIIYLDYIRQRAKPSATATTAIGTALLDSIYLERRMEFAFEGLRMFDLLRLKKGVNRTDGLPSAPKNLPYPSDKAIAPIPRIDASLGMQQNPGY